MEGSAGDQWHLRRGFWAVLNHPRNGVCPLGAEQSVFAGDTLLAIRAPSGTRLEVPIPEVSGERVGSAGVCVCVCWAGVVAGLSRLGAGGQGFDGVGGTGNPRKSPDIKKLPGNSVVWKCVSNCRSSRGRIAVGVRRIACGSVTNCLDSMSCLWEIPALFEKGF